MQLKMVLKVLKEYNVKYYILGNGSNIIFTDKIKECIIKLDFKKSNYLNIFHANELLMVKANEFAKSNYRGLEYLSNIPASIGGAIVMNAGAYNHSISDIIEYVYYIDENLDLKVASKDECKFKYRDSIFKNSKNIVLGCKVKLIDGEYNEIRNIMNECKEKRNNSQPLDMPNSGSIFKNSSNISSWKLIKEINLDGYKKGGAMISDKHSNFIVNIGNAKSNDIIFLINLVKSEVKKTFDIDLEEEVIIID